MVSVLCSRAKMKKLKLTPLTLVPNKVISLKVQEMLVSLTALFQRKMQTLKGPKQEVHKVDIDTSKQKT